MSRANRDRKMLTAAVTTDSLAVRISAALHREYGEFSCAVQRIARAMSPPADPRAVRNWWEGKNAPRSAQMMQLGQVSGEVRLELVRILADQARNEVIAQEGRERHVALTLASDALVSPYLAAAASCGAAFPHHDVDRAVECAGRGDCREDPAIDGSDA